MNKEEEFNNSFTCIVDKLSVHLQIQNIANEMRLIIESKNGKIIQKQTDEQLREAFEEALIRVGDK